MSHVEQRRAELEMEATMPCTASPHPDVFSAAAARRLARAFRPILRAPRAPLSACDVLEFPRRVRAQPLPERSPLDDLRIQDTVRMRVTAYCAYVRVLITAEGVASATRISRKQAQHTLTELARAGKLYVVGRLYQRQEGKQRHIWEWAGGDA